MRKAPVSGSGGVIALPLARPFGLLRQRHGPEAVRVAADQGEGHVGLKAVNPMIGVAVEAMDFEGLDRGLHSEMLDVSENKSMF